MTFSLYRIFDQSGTLLYIGLSSDLENRIYSHRIGGLFGENFVFNSEEFSSKKECALAEKKAIVNENPLFNKQSVPIGNLNFYNRVMPKEFKRMRVLNGWNLEQCSENIKVSTRTIRRYEDELRPKPIPAPVAKLMEIYAERLIKKGEK